MANVDAYRRIVEKHAQALLDELNEIGVDALGVAGGIVMGASVPGSGSPCHVFFVLGEDVGTVTGECSGAAFVRDVAKAMSQYE